MNKTNYTDRIKIAYEILANVHSDLCKETDLNLDEIYFSLGTKNRVLDLYDLINKSNINESNVDNQKTAYWKQTSKAYYPDENDYYTCTNCNSIDENGCRDPNTLTPPYCEYCGAKMCGIIAYVDTNDTNTNTTHNTYIIDGHHIHFNCCDKTLSVLYNESDNIDNICSCPFCNTLVNKIS